MSSNARNSSCEINSVYCLKALCALFVVIMHSTMPWKQNIGEVISMAVPCFYTITGYFLYSGNREAECQRAFRWIKKIGLTYLFVACFYLVVKYVEIGMVMNWKMLIVSLLIGTIPAPHLWYLVALVQGLLLFWVMRRFKLWGVAVLIPAALAHELCKFCFEHHLPVCVYEQIGNTIYYSHLGALYPCGALLLIGGGYFVAKYDIKRFSAIMLIFVVLASFALRHYTCHSTEMFRVFKYPSQAVLAAFILALCLKKPDIKLPILTKIGKCHSANIYYYHGFVYTVLIAMWGDSRGRQYPLVTFLLTLMMSVALTFSMNLLKMGREKLKLMRLS